MKHMFVILSRNICLLFVCVCWREEEGNVLFNDALNTFYFWLYGIGQMSRNICLLFCHKTCLLFVYVCWREEEGNVLFNDALNTFYFRLYGILVMKHMFVILS